MDEEEDLPAGPIREGNPRVFQETSANPRLPQTRTTKTGRVQELVVPKIPKKADSIRAMTGSERFDIKKIFDLPLEVTVREFLDRSDSTIREMAYNMQRSTPRYRVKKSKVIRDEEEENHAVNDGMSLPLMISSWVLNQHLSRTLLDGGSLVELLSKRFIHKMKPRPTIQRDGRIRVSLANDSVTTLDEYVVIPINVEGVEAVIKAWLVDVEVYDLLLGITWMRRANCTQMFGEGKITIKGNDKEIRTVPAKIYPMEVKLPVVEYDEELDTDEWSADDASLTSRPEEDQSLRLSGVTLAALAAHTINNPSYSELSGAFNRATPPIDIKSTQAVNSNKYALGRGDRFPTERRPEKRELSHESDEVIAEWFEKKSDTPGSPSRYSGKAVRS
ncbi:hypothetical protein MMC31_005124 [Peltigera leucophlebia]|nr:hypothetical protein [Peltigera leucophlebia]